MPPLLLPGLAFSSLFLPATWYCCPRPLHTRPGHSFGRLRCLLNRAQPRFSCRISAGLARSRRQRPPRWPGSLWPGEGPLRALFLRLRPRTKPRTRGSGPRPLPSPFNFPQLRRPAPLLGSPVPLLLGFLPLFRRYPPPPPFLCPLSDCPFRPGRPGGRSFHGNGGGGWGPRRRGRAQRQGEDGGEGPGRRVALRQAPGKNAAPSRGCRPGSWDAGSPSKAVYSLGPVCEGLGFFFFFFHWKREATKTNQVIFHVERPGPRRGCEGCACSQKHGGEEPLAAAMKAAELVDSFP